MKESINFKVDDLINYLNKFVKIEIKSKRSQSPYYGWIYTIDPISYR
jgi:hypothetical protein